MSTAELATSYAALILADEGIDITVCARNPATWQRVHRSTLLTSGQADKLQNIINAAKVPDVEPIWTTLFAKVRG